MYPDCIKKPVNELIKELEKYFPNIPEIDSIFKERMEVALYIKLIKAGVIK